MKQYYTAFFIRKADNKVLKRFSVPTMSKFLWKKELALSLDKLLKGNPDLERGDIIVREYEGTIDNYDE